MTLGTINSTISFLTNVDTNVFSNADRLLSMNNHLRDIQTLILRSQDEWDYDDSNNTDLPILTANTVAGQQLYTLPTGSLDIKRLEVTYDGVNYVKAEPFDINERSLATSTNAIGDFSQSAPKYDLMSNTLWLYPIPTGDIEDALKIWISRGPLEFTSGQLVAGTVEPGFDSLFHDMLAFGPAMDFCMTQNLPQTDRLKTEYAEKKQNLINHYGKKQEDRVVNMRFNSVSYK